MDFVYIVDERIFNITGELSKEFRESAYFFCSVYYYRVLSDLVNTNVEVCDRMLKIFQYIFLRI